MKVSVVMITYNHGLFIEKAIESIINQKTNFDFELIISSDASPDNTAEIVHSMIQNHPNGNKIKFTSHPKNIGVMPNFQYALQQATGQYVALCEGDDYWTNDQKLQKQVDFLDNNTNFVICYHPVSIDENGVIKNDSITKVEKLETTILDLAKGNYLHTCSVMYRNHLFESFPAYFTSSPIGDYYLHMLNAKFGSIYCLDENMANYRVHNTSYWSSKQQEEREKIWITFIKNILPDFDEKVQKILKKQIYKLEKKHFSFFQKMAYFFKK